MSETQQLMTGLACAVVQVVHCPKLPAREEPKLKSGSHTTKQVLQQTHVPRVSAFIKGPV